MKYLSVCSGIESATVAWHPLDWEPVAFSEIDPFPSAVLAHHYPGVPNWGDMTKFQEWPDAAVDLLVGGTPCQSFSVAGLRKGLSDPRGNLALTFLAIVDRYRPRWVVWENVPGVLSADSHDDPDPCPPAPPVDLGRDGAEMDTEDEYDADESHAFACLVAGFSELGYFGAYGTLDAQYAGLAQRRKRVFAVFHSGEWQRAAAVLFDRSSLSGDPAPRREAGQVAPTVPARRSGGGGLRTDFDCDGGLIAHSLRADGFDASEDGTGRGTPLVAVDAVAPCLTTNYGKQPDSSDTSAGPMLVPMAFDARQSDVITYGDRSGPLDTDGHSIAIAFSAKDHGADAGDIAPTLRAGGHVGSHANGGVMPAVAQHMSVRRLTPRECERLQGFPDDYTLIPYRGKPAADGPRYKALGNSMAVPVMAWIGRRIQMVDELA